jgi:methyl-accepting chemotaxis protein
MSWFNNLKIGVRLVAGFAVVAAIAAAVGYEGIAKIREIDAADTVLYERMTVPLGELATMGTAFQRVRVGYRDLILADTPAAREKALTQMREFSDEVDKTGVAYEKRISSDRMREAYAAFAASWKAYQPLREQGAQLATDKKTKEALALMHGDLGSTSNAVEAALEKMVAFKTEDGKTKADENTAVADAAARFMMVAAILAALLALGMGFLLARSISRPLGRGVAMVQELAKGHLGTRLHLGRQDEIGVLADAMDGFADDLQTVVVGTMQKIATGDLTTEVVAKDAQDQIAPALKATTDALRGLVAEAGILTKAAVEGRLATRGNAEKFHGSYHDIVQGVNDTLDAVIGPLNVAAEYVDRISKGDIPPKITDTYNGDFNEIKNNLNTCIEALSTLVAEMTHMSREHDAGDIDVAIDTSKFQGAYQAMAAGINTMVAGHITVKKKAMACIAEFGRGNFEAPLDRFPGKKVFINENIERLRTNMQAFIAEMHRMSEEHNKGDIDVAIPVERFEGGYRAMAQGVNDMVAGHITVKKKAMACIAEFGKGNFEAPLDRFPGKKVFINDTIEQMRANLKSLIADAGVLVEAAVAGRLATRADATKHQGDFRKIVEGVNRTLDAVIGPLNVAAEYVDRISKGDIPPAITDTYHGDFNEIKNNLNTCIASIQALVQDAGVLVDAAVGGRLATRADATKHQGDYRKIVEGVNRTLDAVIKPVNEAATVLTKVAQQDLRVQVQGEYAGDHAAIKTSINTMITDLRGSIGAIGQNAQSLGTSAEELSTISQQMAGNAEETATQTHVVSAASEQVSQNLTVVATSSEEMLASIREIAKSANEAARMAKNAVGVADATNQTVQKLGDSSQEIGNVIKVITSIAEQTNLLALNATIEAARAGDAGKGFAVVANEVKELAKETAKATEEISQKIEAIQHDTGGAVQAIGQISQLITQIDGVSNTIATAVEEQTATTNEIGRNITEAARGSAEIARNVGTVATAAQQASQGAADTQKAARALTEMAAQLQSLVGRFSL